uniref:Uncharacterized protein n=1 Tax=Romanomermis culicivorax TaxID=13658 RepID=A0A915HFK0_ROMCU
MFAQWGSHHDDNRTMSNDNGTIGDLYLSADGQIPELNWVNINNLSMPGFDLILSKCQNGRIYLGEVMNDRCRLLRGHIATFSKGFDQYKLPEFENWYVTCLRVDGQLDGPCNSLPLQSDKRIRPRTRVDIVNATTDTVTLLIHVGDLPFKADIRTIVYTRDSNRSRSTTTSYNSIVIQKNAQILPREGNDYNNLDYTTAAEDGIDDKEDGQLDQNYQIVHYTNTVEAAKNRSFKFEVKQMALNSWYIIRTCLVVRTPENFYERYPGLTLPGEDSFCLPDEGYRTPRHLVNEKSSYSRNGGAVHCTFFVCKRGK